MATAIVDLEAMVTVIVDLAAMATVIVDLVVNLDKEVTTIRTVIIETMHGLILITMVNNFYYISDH
jgi:hypothetical protein